MAVGGQCRSGWRRNQRQGSLADGLPLQDEGELCVNSAQCKSKCCHRTSGLSLARCAPKASENSECSAKVGAGGLGVVVVGGERGSPDEEGPGGLEWGQRGWSAWTSNVEEIKRWRSTGFKALSHPMVSLDPHD